MSHKELQKFKEAAAKIAREHDTPEKAREILTKMGYLNADGEVAEKYRSAREELMANGDKRSVSTDALETLGTIIDEGAGRDAIHLAVEPVIAGQPLFAGDHVGFLEDGTAGKCDTPLGIVDPFLSREVNVGERFWMVVYPRQITSLRHVWTHPAFKESATPGPSGPTPESESMRWIEGFADRIGQYPDALMGAAEKWLDAGGGWEGYTYDNSESYKDHWDEFPVFWQHYAIVTGKNIPEDSRESFFTCGC